MRFSARILRLFGWSVDITVPDSPKAIICVAPHTSNWDFILGKLAYASVGRKAGFLMKSSWFFFPLGPILRAMGGIPVVRKNKKRSLVEEITHLYQTHDRLTLAITPEGTRKAVAKWRSGFIHIAINADIPVYLGVIDYATKRIMIKDSFVPTGDVEADMARVKAYYKPFAGKYPDKFITD